MERTRRLALIGFMGTGKSRWGRELARRLGWRHWDCDELIRREEGRSIPWIFKSRGEDYFRRKETRILRRLLHHPKVVISTGGGVVTKKENRDLLKYKSFVIWLTASERVILRRVGKGPTRPLLQGGPLPLKIRGLLRIRKPLYQSCADVTLRSDAPRVMERIERILKREGILTHVAL